MNPFAWDKKGWHVDARGAASEIRTLNILFRNTTLEKKKNAWMQRQFEALGNNFKTGEMLGNVCPPSILPFLMEMTDKGKEYYE